MDLRKNDLEFDKQVAVLLAVCQVFFIIRNWQSLAGDANDFARLCDARTLDVNWVTVIMRKGVIEAEESVMERNRVDIIEIMAHATEVARRRGRVDLDDNVASVHIRVLVGHAFKDILSTFACTSIYFYFDVCCVR